MSWRKAIWWSTHIGIIEAIDHIVAQAISNGNIPDQNYWYTLK